MKKILCDPGAIFNPEVNQLPAIFPLGPEGNPFHQYEVDIYPIPLFSSYMPNVKALVARRLFENAKERGLLKGITTLVEASSGNTLFSLALLAPYYGITDIVAVTDRDIAPRKREMLELAGVGRFIYPKEDETTIQTARRLGKQSGWLNLDQYANPENWRAHYSHSGPHIWKGTRRKISVFCAAMGTTGTIVGVGKYLRSRTSSITIIGAACAPDNPIPGARALSRIEDSFDWRKWVDQVIEVRRYPAYLASLRLLRLGGMFGPTSGLAFAALAEYLHCMSKARGLDSLRNKEGRVVAGFACGDSIMPYGEKYSTILDGPEFNPLQVG